MQVELLEIDACPLGSYRSRGGMCRAERRVLPDRRVNRADNALYGWRRKVIRRQSDRELARFLSGQSGQPGDLEYICGCPVAAD